MPYFKFQLLTLLVASVFIFHCSMHVEENQKVWVNSTVSKDGPGDHKTIMEAIKSAPIYSKHRFIILIKKGVYQERVMIGANKTRITLRGEGMGNTRIVANRSVGRSNTSSYHTATLEIYGHLFVAMDLTVENNAGPEMMQAVAVRSDVDSAFYRCKFLGYQDTVLANKKKQLYRECHIYGTIDFVWGDAAMVMQNCQIFVQKPLPYQFNVITAQGRDTFSNETTGIVMHQCSIAATPELKKSKRRFETYLGRPWKTLSTVVIMKTSMEGFINPKGWHIWDNKTQTDKLFYGEYNNSGPGSSTTGRVNWPGWKKFTKTSEVERFSVRNFFVGHTWLNSTGVPYQLDL